MARMSVQGSPEEPAHSEEFPQRIEIPAQADFKGAISSGIENAENPYLCVYASQVAVCIGANRHKKISDAVESMWQRIAPRSFFAAMERNGLKTDDQSVTEIMATNDSVKDLITQSLVMPSDTSARVADNYATVSHTLELADIDEDSRKLVDDVVKRNLYTTYGNAQENDTLEYIRTRLGIPCSPDPAFHKIQMGTIDGVPWFVGGKIDAMSDDKSLVIEIKNRVNRLFHRAPFYEVVQVQTYLELLNVDRGALVECLKTDDGHPHVNVIPIRRDPGLWNDDIVPKLRGFVGFVLRLLNDEKLQDKFLQSKRRSALVLANTR